MQNVLEFVLSVGCLLLGVLCAFMVKIALRAFLRGYEAFWGQFLKLIAATELMLSANHLNQVFCQQLHLV